MTGQQLRNVLASFHAEPVYSKYGVVNAITAAAQAEDEFDNRYELERLSSKVLEAPVPEAWQN